MMGLTRLRYVRRRDSDEVCGAFLPWDKVRMCSKFSLAEGVSFEGDLIWKSVVSRISGAVKGGSERPFFTGASCCIALQMKLMASGAYRSDLTWYLRRREQA